MKFSVLSMILLSTYYYGGYTKEEPPPAPCGVEDAYCETYIIDGCDPMRICENYDYEAYIVNRNTGEMICCGTDDERCAEMATDLFCYF